MLDNDEMGSKNEDKEAPFYDEKRPAFAAKPVETSEFEKPVTTDKLEEFERLLEEVGEENVLVR